VLVQVDARSIEGAPFFDGIEIPALPGLTGDDVLASLGRAHGDTEAVDAVISQWFSHSSSLMDLVSPYNPQRVTPCPSSTNSEVRIAVGIICRFELRHQAHDRLGRCRGDLLPIIPDFFLALLIVSRPERWRRMLFLAISGSAVGGIAIFAGAQLNPVIASQALTWLPLVFPSDITQVQNLISEHGSMAYSQQPISGIPFKVWGITGGSMGLSLLATSPIFIVSRSLRMTAVALLALGFGRSLHGLIARYPTQLFVLYVLIFTVGWVRTMPLGR
jgi:membrane protein YqaA with SNARE-associated domain